MEMTTATSRRWTARRLMEERNGGATSTTIPTPRVLSRNYDGRRRGALRVETRLVQSRRHP